MTVTERPTIRLLSLWLQVPVANAFILGQSLLNVGRLTAAPGWTWKSYLLNATSVNAQRGGSRTGLSVGMEVGTMTITFREPALGGNVELVPRRAIRLSNKGDTQPFFTGEIVDVDYTFQYDKRLRQIVRIVTIVAVDPVQAHAAATRFGASSGNGIDGFETWEARIRRLAASSITPVVPPVEPATVNRYTMPATSNLDGWSYFGSPNGTVAPYPIAKEQVSISTPPSNPYAVVRRMDSTNRITIERGSQGLRRTITGLTPGRLYTLSAWGAYAGALTPTGTAVMSTYMLGVTGVGWGDPVSFYERGAAYLFPSYTFRATSTEHQVLVGLGADTMVEPQPDSEYLALLEFTVTQDATIAGYLMGNTVLESSLANHFDIACMSAGAYWWVDAAGITRFGRDLPGTADVAVFTDKRTAGQREYVGLDANYDTRAVVNDLAVTNHESAYDADGVTIVSGDREMVLTDDTSQGTWGPRSGSAGFTVYDKGTQAGALVARARELLAEHRTALYTPHRIVWNAQEFPALVAALDVFAPVRVISGGQQFLMRIINIKHEITPTRWLVTLELIGR